MSKGSKGSKGNLSIHLFYGIVSLFVYYGVTMVVLQISKYMLWDSNLINLVNEVANLTVLYVACYLTYELRGGTRELPPLLPFSKKSSSSRSVTKKTYVWSFILGMSASIAVNNWFVIFRMHEKITTYKRVADSIYHGSIIVVLLKTVVLAALVEEVLMRGLVYRGLSHVLGRILAVLLSAAIFGVIHGNLLQGIYAFFIGILFAYVYDMCGRRLLGPILAHMAANLASVIGTMIPVVIAFMGRYFYLVTLVFTVLLVISVFAVAGFTVKRKQG